MAFTNFIFLHIKIMIETVPGTNQYWALKVVSCSRKTQESLMWLKLAPDRHPPNTSHLTVEIFTLTQKIKPSVLS